MPYNVAKWAKMYRHMDVYPVAWAQSYNKAYEYPDDIKDMITRTNDWAKIEAMALEATKGREPVE